jgi:hypothetical protein
VPEEDRTQAQQRIGEIVADIKEIIQQEIENEENTPTILFESNQTIREGEENETEQEFIQEQEKEKQERIKQLKLGLKKQTVGQFRRFNQEWLESEEIEGLLEE